MVGCGLAEQYASRRAWHCGTDRGRCDIRTTMNIDGDAASADMREAHGKIVQMALHGSNGRCGFVNY